MLLSKLNLFRFAGPLRSYASFLSSHITSCKALTFSEFGEPENVLFQTEKPIGDVGHDELIVRMCAAPIHPSDINTVQGVYGIKPTLPAVPGNEGVGKVVAVGSGVKGFSINDLVIPYVVSSSTWETYVRAKASNYYSIPHPMSASDAAVLRINPGTALRMLTDFVQLKPGDVIIQNGSTSAVGIYVIQLAKLLGWRTINLFRARDTAEATEETRKILMDYGATWALTDAEFANDALPDTKAAKQTGCVRLALNCLGGKPSLTLLKVLDNGGTLVSYGAMTRNPMPIPVGPLIFRDYRLRGFWFSSWIHHKEPSEVHTMLDHLSEMFSKQLLRPSPFVEIPFDDWKRAINLAKFDDAGPSGVRRKIILRMSSD